MANVLVGNIGDASALELASATIELTFSETTSFALVGGGHTAELDGKPMGMNFRAEAMAGCVLTVRPDRHGFRAYLALPGTLESKDGKLTATSRLFQPVRLAEWPRSVTDSPIRVVGRSVPPGRVSVHLDRMGVRIETVAGVEVPARAVSRPAIFGAIQQTPDGTLLIHGPEGPTIGGYDVLAVVARSDLNRIAQLVPGQEIQFEQVTLDRASQLFCDESERLARIVERIRLAG